MDPSESCRLHCRFRQAARIERKQKKLTLRLEHSVSTTAYTTRRVTHPRGYSRSRPQNRRSTQSPCYAVLRCCRARLEMERAAFQELRGPRSRKIRYGSGRAQPQPDQHVAKVGSSSMYLLAIS